MVALSAGSFAARTFTAGAPIPDFQVPAATGGNGTISYAASNLPAGLRFDATGTDAPGCPGTEPREVCGTPTTVGAARTVTITATDADGNIAAGGRATLTFPVTVASGASLASSPAPLTEANLDGATLTVTLAGAALTGGLSPSSFTLVSNPTLAGLSIASVSGGAAGSTTATLTLAPGTTVRTFAVSATARRSPTRRSWCDCALP